MPYSTLSLPEEALARYSLLAYFLVYVALAFGWRSLVVYQSTGVNPFVLPSGDDAYSYVGRAFKALVGAYALVVLLLTFGDSASGFLGAFAVPWPRAASIAGWVLLAVSLVWLLVAQVQMGASWRVGIDSKRRTELVQHGLFSVSRNPIFLAMRLNLLGLFLVFPAASTLVLLVAGEILMQVQVRLEEQHLSALHGEAYRAYRSRVRRWL
jgi:protein-S-isoprenylcysteine O-methyltransferase Ste14